ncbi:WG repeat-containing protein [Paenibacillus sp. EPM92]|uniref:WG repeat-containing protein n=1 Tax=Paenibacillus sp. EPM92 TaxID=1561195 RepID=UPI001915C259|nr:WG repeat-containing protein [Paenibacillus sp. EPM92]
MNNPKYPAHSSIKFKPGITVIRQLQINEYGFGQDFYGLIDDQGNEIVSCECQYFKPIDNGLIVTENNHELFGILDRAGNFLVPFSRGYQSIDRFHEGLALVRSARLPLSYGFIDRQGNEVIPLQYYDAGCFHGGMVAVRTFDDRWCFINREGKQLFSFPQ